MMETEDMDLTEGPAIRVGTFLGKKTPGVNLDHVDVDAGMAMLAASGYDDPSTVMVINHALLLWRRGEEGQAEKNAIDQSFHGIDYTTWRMVVAAAVGEGNRKALA